MKFFNPKQIVYFYDFLWLLITPLIPILLIYRLMIGKEEISRIKERFGYSSINIQKKREKLIWLHGASLGEIVSATSLSIGLREVGFKGKILITSGTITSSYFLKKNKDIIHQYHPLDNRKWVNRFLNFWKPDILIMVESEIWPNFIICSKNKKIPIIMASAQVSNSSFKRMSKIGYDNTNFLFSQIDQIFTTDENQTKKFKLMGADKVSTSQSLKVSLPPILPDENLIKKFQNISSQRTIVLAASTREYEEEILIDCVKKLNQESFKILLIIAPRHIKRSSIISKLSNPKIKSKSKKEFPNLDDEFWISDTYGEMPTLYSLSEIVFVGGSLHPYGGHNPSEACHYNTSIIIGPHTEKCQNIVNQMKKEKAIIQLNSNSVDELTETFKMILSNNHFKNDFKNASFLLTKEWTKERNRVANNIVENFNLIN